MVAEKLLAPVCVSPNPHVDDILIRLQKARQLVLATDTISASLTEELLRAIDCSFNFISSCRILQPGEIISKKEGIKETEEEGENEVEDKEEADGRKSLGRFKRKRQNSMETPTNRISKPINIKPVQLHLLDRLDEDPIDL